MAVSHLREFSATDVDRAGGKGANLGELIRSGFPIPPGFVVCADEYAAAIETFSTELAPGEMPACIEGWQAPADLVQRIHDCHNELQATRATPLVYAVRSSATAEDLGDASFAGQHDTFYYVTANELLPMIKACWASLWREEAIAYRQAQGIVHQSVQMAVVVQEMIPSDVSGITFTVNPLNGNREEIVTDASWGMGAAIVDGRVTPDHFVVTRQNEDITLHRIARKTNMVSTKREASGHRMIEVPYHLQQAPCLNDEQLIDISRWALKAEAHFGRPQDLEWAIHEGAFYMLQSRPITTLEYDEDEPEETRKVVLFKSVAENFTEPLTPLTIDIVRQSAAGSIFFKGRVYQPVLLAKLLAPVKMTDEQAAELMCLEVPENFKLKINWLTLPLSLLVWFIIYELAGVGMARSRRMPDDFMEVARDRVAQLDADDSLSPGHAMQRLFMIGKPFHPVGLQIMPMNLTSVIRYFALMGLLNRLLSHWLPDVQRDAGSLLCSGSFGVKSTEMGRSIFRLSQLAKQNEAVAAIFAAHAPEDIEAVLRQTPAAAEFIAGLDAFLAEHGHRALKEFELASPRFEENPAPILAMARNYLLSNVDPVEMEQHTTRARVALAESLQTELGKLPLEHGFRWRWRIVQYLAGRARNFIKLRENTRFYHIMGWRLARRKVLRAEQTLIARGQLKVKGDIFYLVWSEVRALLDGLLHWEDVEEVIRNRRMNNLRWSKQDPPKTINIKRSARPRPLVEGELGGQGASPGEYEGIARVIMDPSVDAEIHPGEILVAPYTDPAWTPLFLVARAAVVGVGSYLSHAGTIAREYGMPCVVDVTDCTSLISTGDRIKVDGTNGVVQLLPALEPAA